MAQPDALATHVEGLLRELGEDPAREGLVDTPARVARALRRLTTGYTQSLDDIVGGAIFEEACNEMVVCRDIDFFSLCEHHLLPFFGRAHIAYIPRGRIIGLSKIARIVEMFARRLQVQERLTTQIARSLEEVLRPMGVAVVMEGVHLCMVMRGVEKQNSVAVTSAMLGEFQTNPSTRSEFLSLVRPAR